MCQIASLFLLQRLKGSMSGDARDFKTSRRELSSSFFFPARQGAEENSRHSERNIMGTRHSEGNIMETCTIACHRQKLGGPA